MKFLCVPCDSPMKLQTVGPPERGSLSVVYACPECGYEIAMLTNAYETQVVQSLGVRIGPDRARASAEASTTEAGASASGCPFAAMIPASAKATAGTPSISKPLWRLGAKIKGGDLAITARLRAAPPIASARQAPKGSPVPAALHLQATRPRPS